MTHDEPLPRVRALDELERRLRALVGERATIERHEIGYDWDVVEVTPRRASARAITISSEERLTVMLGRATGHFAFDYDDEGMAAAHELLAATIPGHVTERPGLLGTRVIVQLSDGRRMAKTAFAVPPVLFGPNRNVPRRRYVGS